FRREDAGAEYPDPPASPVRGGRDVRACSRAGPLRPCAADARGSGLQGHRGRAGPRVLRSGALRARLRTLDGPRAARVPASSRDQVPERGIPGREAGVFGGRRAAIPGLLDHRPHTNAADRDRAATRWTSEIRRIGMTRLVTLVMVGLLALTLDLARAAGP